MLSSPTESSKAALLTEYSPRPDSPLRTEYLKSSLLTAPPLRAESPESSLLAEPLKSSLLGEPSLPAGSSASPPFNDLMKIHDNIRLLANPLPGN